MVNTKRRHRALRMGKASVPIRTIGYARVSTLDQSLALQVNALERAGCVMIFRDEGISGASDDRPGLAAALQELQPGDMLAVWRLDRLGRSLVHLVGVISDLSTRNVEFRSLTENIDTSSAGGRLVFHMMAALAEFERSLISERTRAGMDAVRQAGQRLGRPAALTASEQENAVSAVVLQGENVSSVAARYGVHSRTIYRLITASRSGSLDLDPRIWRASSSTGKMQEPP